MPRQTPHPPTLPLPLPPTGFCHAAIVQPCLRGCRCPGRYFAEAELALAAATLLLLFDLRLLLREAADPAGADAGAAAGAAGGGRAAAAAAGGGVGTAPGDPAGLLPPPDLTRLVGVKVPAGACWVQYQRRRP